MIAGLAYEVIRFGGKHPQNPIVRTLLAPGLWLQSLTTREPTLDQVEVSIQALRDVLDAEAAGIGPLARRGHGVSSAACREPTPKTRCAA